jgi:hypothetical protein
MSCKSGFRRFRRSSGTIFSQFFGRLGAIGAAESRQRRDWERNWDFFVSPQEDVARVDVSETAGRESCWRREEKEVDKEKKTRLTVVSTTCTHLES